MIAGRMGAVAEDGVVQEIRERGQRAVKPSGHPVVPILLGQDEVEILGRRSPDSGILQNGGIVQRQAGPEGIGIGQECESPERQHEKRAADVRSFFLHRIMTILEHTVFNSGPSGSGSARLENR
jgi:hypothetical protein